MGLAVLFNNLQAMAVGGVIPPGPSDIQAGSAKISVSDYRTIIRPRIPELSSQTIKLIFSDDDGESLTVETLNELKLTIAVLGAGPIVNSRDRSDILNANGGEVVASGSPGILTITFAMAPADNAMIGEDAVEWHMVLFEWKWSNSQKAARFQMLLAVKNLDRVP